MDWNQAKGNWKEMKGEVKSQWGRLTDDDLTQISGDRDQLEGAIQRRYGYTKEKAKQEIEAWGDSAMAQLNGAAQSVQRVAGNLGTAVERSTREQPYTTLGMAVVIGFALGALWKL
jgi:uncharacterized protein YjbJ (UPF0337 family)